MAQRIHERVSVARLFRHVCAVSLLLVSIFNPVHALVIRGGGEVYVSEKISDDLIIAGTNGMFNGEVVGDIIAAGMDIAVDGRIDGNVIAAGYMVKVGGHVYRSVRLAGYKLTADGQVRNNLAMAGAMARVGSTCEVGNDVHIMGGIVSISGVIHGGLNVRADEVTIMGRIGEDVRVWCEKLTIEPSAEILGDLIYSSVERATIADGAQIDGAVKWQKITRSDSGQLDSFVITALLFVGAFIVGLLMFGLCRTPACAATGVIVANLPKALGVGAVTFIVVPVVLILAMVFVVTIPASLLGLLAYIVLFYVSKLFVAAWLGSRLIRVISSSEPKSCTLSLFIGLLILTILFNVPYLGTIVYLVTVMIGLGGIVIAFNNSRKAARQP